MSVTDARCQLVTALPTRAAYAAVPSPSTLAELLDDADARGLRDCLPAVLARQFDASSDWRTAQHLANELLLAGQSIEVAFYYADRALQLSGGNAFARLSVARCFWVQRFPKQCSTTSASFVTTCDAFHLQRADNTFMTRL